MAAPQGLNASPDGGPAHYNRSDRSPEPLTCAFDHRCCLLEAYSKGGGIFGIVYLLLFGAELLFSHLSVLFQARQPLWKNGFTGIFQVKEIAFWSPCPCCSGGDSDLSFSLLLHSLLVMPLIFLLLIYSEVLGVELLETSV